MSSANPTLLAAFALALALGTVGVYWLYTLLELAFLRRLAHPVPRMLGFGLAFGAAWFAQSAAMLAWMNAPEPKPPPDVMGFGAILGVTLLALYAWRRQWLVPKPAAPLSAVNDTLADEEPVAVIASSEAIPIRWLNTVRTARWRDTVVVHCGLSRSLAAFKAPRGATMAAFIPTRTGFAIGDARQLWDGVDGTPVGVVSSDGAPALPRQPVALMTAATWRRAYPESIVLGPVPLPAPRPMLSPATRSSRGMEDGMRWGVVVDGTWRALDASLQPAFPGEKRAEASEPPYFLARWAAIARGIQGGDGSAP